MTRIEFSVPAIPIAQPRPRATTVNGRARMFEAKKEHPVHAFKATVRLAASAAYAGPPLDGPLYVAMTFVFPRPKNMVWKTRPMPRARHAKKPDCDNAIKAIFDSLNGRLWVDDAQVSDCRCSKRVAAGDEQPHVEIKVRVLED